MIQKCFDDIINIIYNKLELSTISVNLINDLQKQIIELHNELKELKESHQNLKISHEQVLTINNNSDKVLTCDLLTCNKLISCKGIIECTDLTTSSGTNGGNITTGNLYGIGNTSTNELNIIASSINMIDNTSDPGVVVIPKKTVIITKIESPTPPPQN